MKIIIVCNHRGGANALFPIASVLKKSNHNVLIVTTVLNKNIFKKKFFNRVIFNSKANNSNVTKFIDCYQPNIVITGTSEVEDPKVGSLEAFFIHVANKKNIFTLSLVDFPSNYYERFSLNKKNLLESIPNEICVMNQFMKDDMIKNYNFKKNNLKITGNPYLEHLNNKIKVNTKKIKQLRSKLIIDNKTKIFLFLSQPIYDRLKISKGTKNINYDEKKVLVDLLNVINKLQNQNLVDNSKLIIKLHPSENSKKFDSIIKMYSQIKIEITHEKYNIYVLAKSVDHIIGMFSTLLIELASISCDVINYQPEEQKNLIKIMNTKIINNKDDLFKRLTKKTLSKTINQRKSNSLEKILTIIERGFKSNVQ